MPLLIRKALRCASTPTLRFCVVLAVACVFAPQTSAEPPPVALATAVKASFLYKFAPFVEWPPGALPPPGSPFMICVPSADPIASALEDAVRGQSIEGHPIAVRRLTALTEAAGCKVLFLGPPAASGAEALLRSVGAEPVLTVSDEGAPLKGTMIQFVSRDGHVRFTVDPAAAEAHHLILGAKLRFLAVPPRGD